MKLSFWRYSHLVLAVFCFLFLTVASVTGIILGIDAAKSPQPPYNVKEVKQVTLDKLIPQLQSEYTEVTSLEVKDHHFVVLKAIDLDGKEVAGFIQPNTGKIIGKYQEKSPFIQSVTSLHRSLFLHETGRLIVGLTSLILVFVTISGIALVIKQQKGLRRFFSSFSKESFSQYYHVNLGRWSLVFILIIAITGSVLSMEKLGILNDKKVELRVPKNGRESEQIDPSKFKIFQTIHLNDVQSIDFPFADDPDEYYKIKLQDKEILVNQFDGKIEDTKNYPLMHLFLTTSLVLHTGQASASWAVFLTVATFGILFFIFSGFAITFKRQKNKLKNKIKPDTAEVLLYVGTENGTTIHFANKISEQLNQHGIPTYQTDLNNFEVFPSTSKIIIFTSTYGLGDAPGNADRFLGKLDEITAMNQIDYSIVGFGSTQYPDFCGFASRVAEAVKDVNWLQAQLPLYKVDEKSTTDFVKWVKAWSDVNQCALIDTATYYSLEDTIKKESFTVTEKTVLEGEESSFLVKLKPNSKMKFTSGDLFAIYPKNDHIERLYSIGKVGEEIQLIVKLHPSGLGSGFLYSLENGQQISAAVQSNHGFHIHDNQPTTIMISNGTGIAPFLGMLEENTQPFEAHLYAGFQREHALQKNITSKLEQFKSAKKVSNFKIAYSRETEDKQYVSHLLQADMSAVKEILDNGGQIMICGSLQMHKDILEILEKNCANYHIYQSNNQIKSDCY